MARKAVEALKRALLKSGPSILKGTVFDHYGKDGKPVTGPRLQSAGQGPPGDVHNSGRALDIFVYSQTPPLFKSPSPERAIGYGLVNVFLELQSSMKWDTMAYDGREWNSQGVQFPKKKAKYTSEMERVNHEHLTHIHIDWSVSNADEESFFDELVEYLESDPGDET